MTSLAASVIGPAGLVLIPLVAPSAVATDGPNVQATVSLSQWQMDPPVLVPFDR